MNMNKGIVLGIVFLFVVMSFTSISGIQIYENIGDWGEFEVTIPRDKEINKQFLNWLQSYPNLFPLLQKLISQLGFGL